jgi:Flp pilus assembly protein TadG
MFQAFEEAERGSVFVEAVIVMPLLLLLIAGMIQFGYFFGLLSNLRSASTLAARSAVLGTGLSATEVCDNARRALSSMFDPTRLTCATNPVTLPVAANSPVTISLSYPAPVIASFGGFGSEGVWTVRADTTMQ